jgi:hypothetical protein
MLCSRHCSVRCVSGHTTVASSFRIEWNANTFCGEADKLEVSLRHPILMRERCLTLAAMKVKTISRSEEAETRGSRREVLKVHKNTDPRLHPFEKAREVSAAGGGGGGG